MVVLSTGGTIASTHDKTGAVVPTVTGSKLVEPLSGAFDKDKLTLEVKDIAKLDSSAMTLDDTDSIITAVNKELRRDDVDLDDLADFTERLNEVFERRLGNPISLAVVQIEVARRQRRPGMRLQAPAVTLPHHPADIDAEARLQAVLLLQHLQQLLRLDAVLP